MKKYKFRATIEFEIEDESYENAVMHLNDYDLNLADIIEVLNLIKA